MADPSSSPRPGPAHELRQFDVPIWPGSASSPPSSACSSSTSCSSATRSEIAIKEAAIESRRSGSRSGLALHVRDAGLARRAGGRRVPRGYLIEKSLSIDNVFVWAVIFTYFAVSREYQFRVAVLGHLRRARAARHLHLRRRRADRALRLGPRTSSARSSLVTAVQIARHDGRRRCDPENNLVLRLVRRVVPSTDRVRRAEALHPAHRQAAGHAAVRRADPGRDDRRRLRRRSIPAILAVSHEPFIVFASNAFADPRAAVPVLPASPAWPDRFRYLNMRPRRHHRLHRAGDYPVTTSSTRPPGSAWL